MRESLMCPSRGADHLYDGGDPTDMQDAVLALLEAENLPSKINDQIMVLIQQGEALIHGPIPEGVYWSREHGNFYDAANNEGQGVLFYEAWRDRKDEFPQK